MPYQTAFVVLFKNILRSRQEMLTSSRFMLGRASSRTAMVLNCGSSSVKYQLFEDDNSLLRGSIENIGSPKWSHKTNSSASTNSTGIIDYPGAIKLAIASVLEVSSDISCVGHRVVHGGPKLTHPTLVTDDVLDEIRECSQLAPLHNPSNIRGIELAREALKEVPQVACFDTAFHAHLPLKAYRYAIPREFADSNNIRRYGFHGLSYSFISDSVKHRRIIVAHLGSGCSISAIVDGKSIDTSMGFTPMEGLVMSTRSGSIDPGLILHIARSFNGDFDKVSQLLNKQSGLTGISGISSDMKELLRLEKSEGDAHSQNAHEAIEVFVYAVQKYIGQYMASLDFDVDAIVFTGGIGENSPEIRERIIRPFRGIGCRIDNARNMSAGASGYISTPDSKIKLIAIPTNEELQIAREAVRTASVFK